MAFSLTKILKGLKIVKEGTLTPDSIEILPNGNAGTKTTVQSSQTSDITLTLPSVTDTLVGTSVTNTLANKTLSNLTSPTSINQALIPDSAGTRNLGDAATKWGNTYFTTSYANSHDANYFGVTNGYAGGIKASIDSHTSPSGDDVVSLQGQNTQIVGVDTGNSFSATASAKVVIATGNNSSTGDSGDILLRTGTVIGGTRGKVSLVGSYIDANSTKIQNVTDPTSAQDAATKNYTDTGISTHAALTSTHGVSGDLVGTTDTQTLTNKTLTLPTIDIVNYDGQASTPSNPSAGFYKVYVKDDGKMYVLDSTGTETEIGTGAGASNFSVERFSGDSSTFNFNLSSAPASENNTFIYINGVYQQKDTYSLAGTTISFSAAPPTGTNNIEVAFGTALNIGTPSDGTVTAAKMDPAFLASLTGNYSIDRFSGDGSTTAFVLTSDPGSENNTFVYIDGVYQQKDTYSLVGTTITFTEAPTIGTDNIEISYAAPLTIGVPSDATVTEAKMAPALLSTLENPDNMLEYKGTAEIGVTTGWSLDSVSAATRPSGALLGSSTGLTLAASATNPLTGSYSYVLSKDNSNRQGKLAYVNFAIPLENRAKVLSARLPYIVNSGTFTAGSSSSDSDLIVYIREYNGSTYTWKEPSSFKFLSNSSSISDELRCEFQTNYDSISADLVLYVASTSANAYELKFEGSVFPSKYVYGTPITDWQTSSLTPANFAVSSSTCHRRRVGDSYEYRYFGTVSSVSGYMGLDVVGCTIDTSKLPSASLQPVGTALGYDLSVTDIYTAAVYTNSTTRVELGNTTGGGNYGWNATQPFTWASGDIISVDFSVPILGLSSSVQMSDGYEGREVAVTAYRSTTQTVSTEATVAFNGLLSRDTVNGFDTTTGIYTVKSAGRYRLSTDIRISTSASPSGQIVGFFRKISSGVNTDYYFETGTDYVINTVYNLHGYIEIDAKAGDTFQIRMSAATNSIDIQNGHNNFSISKSQAPTTISASEKIVSIYNTAAAPSIPNGAFTIVDFGTVENTTHGSVTTGASWKFTAPRAGFYSVSALIQYFTGGGWDVSEEAVLQIYKNGSIGPRLGGYSPQTTHSSYVYVQGSREIYLNSGDYIDIRAYQASGGSVTLTNSANNNWVSIKSL